MSNSFETNIKKNKEYLKQAQKSSGIGKGLEDIIEKAIAPQHRATPEFPRGVATYKEWLREILVKDILTFLKSQMKQTTIGEERSVPNGTEIYFLFKEELEEEEAMKK